MPQDRPSWFSRLGTLVVTLGVAAFALGLVVFAVVAIGRGAAAVAPAGVAEAVPVRVISPERLEGYGVARRFTGQFEATRRVDLAFEFGGRLSEFTAEEGERLPEGAMLARLDTAALAAERRALLAERDAGRAQVELARLTAGRQQALQDRGVASLQANDAARLELAAAEARLAAIEAQIAGVDVRLEKSELRVPFDAVLGARLADPGQTVAAGQALVTLLEDTGPRLRVGLPAALAARLAIGGAVSVEVGGRAYPARIEHLRADLDPATRTRSLVVALEAAEAQPFGLTGTLVIEEAVAEPGYWLPLEALREGARGGWTVLLASGGTAAVEAVEVIHAETGRVFVRAAFQPGAAVIAAAPDRAVPGQPVRVVE